MIISNLEITEGIFHKKVEFTEDVNLIFSTNNSVGKTTLIRFLLYALGYHIPSTKGINFEKCTCKIKIQTDNNEYLIIRGVNYLDVNTRDGKTTYILPNEHNQFISNVIGTNNQDLLNNLLGVIYIDQEKGWTLLNRGVVIGKIRFNIEQFVRGLSEKDCTELFNRLESVDVELKKYKQMFNLSEYQKGVSHLQGNIYHESLEENIKKEILGLQLEKGNLTIELKSLEKAINENDDFKKFIEKMKITVKSSGGEIIPVNKNTIVDFSDLQNLLYSRRIIILNEVSKIESQIKVLRRKLVKESNLAETESLIEKFDKSISKIELDSVQIMSIIEKLNAEKVEIRAQISKFTKTDDDVLLDLHGTILKYASELEVIDFIKQNRDYIFTSDLKSLSGAILHKLVFIFRLAYITALEKHLGIKLPLIIDSPSGREVEKENIEDMINILKRDFSKNQLIIASIYNYSFDSVNRIEINERLLES